MVIQGGLDDAIDAIYAATLDERGWTRALRAVVLGGGHGVTLEMHDRATRELLSFEETGMPAATSATWWAESSPTTANDAGSA